MGLRYFFGPATREFTEQNLAGPIRAGECIAFGEDPDAHFRIRPGDSWEQVRERLPAGWEPDFTALWLPYTTVPTCLWSAPLVRVGLAADWNLLWTYYQSALRACDLVFADTPGTELLQKAGIGQARVGYLCGCDGRLFDEPMPEGARDIDVLIAGNLHAAVQAERLPWIARLGRLAGKRRIVTRAGVPPDAYRKLLARSRIVFQFSSRGKCGRRSFEAAAAGALVFQEEGNRELPAFFRDRQECVYYNAKNLEERLEYYLEHEEKRQAIVAAARSRARTCRFEDFWRQIVGTVQEQWTSRGRVQASRLHYEASGADHQGGDELLLLRCLDASRSLRFEDAMLVADLEKRQGRPAWLESALGVMLWRQAFGRNHFRAAAEVGVEFFRRALDAGFVLAGLNLAEALEACENRLGAIEAAGRTLEIMSRKAALDGPELTGLCVSRGFDHFQVEWERAGWAHAGNPAEEARAKRDLLAWRLYSLLGAWTEEPRFYYEATLLRPDLGASRRQLGVGLARVGQGSEALPHLRRAVEANPFERDASRALFHVLGGSGDRDSQQRLVEDQRLFFRTAPSMAPLEFWFAGPRPAGNELASIIILCCNQLEFTRQCIDSLLRHTRKPFELIVVDNGSTDGTAEYLEELKLSAESGARSADFTLRAPRSALHTTPDRVLIIRNDINRGYAVGCNQGLREAKGEYLVLLNNDTVLTPGWLDGLVSCVVQEWPRVGLVGPVTNGAPDAQGIRPDYSDMADLDAFAATRKKRFQGKTITVNRLTGFCLLMRRPVLDLIGGLDERFGNGFFEDDDLCVRAREAGFGLAVAEDVYIHHFGNRTFQALGIETRAQLVENLERFRQKWGQEYAAAYHVPPAPSDNGDTSTQAMEQAVSEAARPAPAAGALESTTLAPVTEPAAEPRLPAIEVMPALDGVSLTMIVKNEEHHLPDCLRSVQGLFPDIVVVDTGSTDRTRDIARSFGARVFDFPWVDSFSAARNEALRHARGKWVLWLDADDRLDQENRKTLKELLADLPDTLDAYAMKVRSVLDAERTLFRLLDQVRLYRNLPGIGWDYRIHEQILPSVNRLGGVVRFCGVIIDHVGYQDGGARKGKLERNLRLLELDYADRPEDGFTLFNLGWTLLDLGRNAEALEQLRQSLVYTKPTSSTLRKLHHLLAVAQRQLRQTDEALTTCRQALEKYPDDAELLCEQGFLLRDRGDFAGAEESWMRLLDVPRGSYFASEEIGLRGFRTRQLVAEIYRMRERRVEAEVQWRAALHERKDFEPAWTGLADLYLQQERWSDVEYLLQDLDDRGLPESKLSWIRARAQALRKDLAAARRTVRTIIAQDGKALGPRVLLSQVLLHEGRDWNAAERALRDVLEIDPNHAETRHNLAVLLRRLGRQGAMI